MGRSIGLGAMVVRRDSVFPLIIVNKFVSTRVIDMRYPDCGCQNILRSWANRFDEFRTTERSCTSNKHLGLSLCLSKLIDQYDSVS